MRAIKKRLKRIDSLCWAYCLSKRFVDALLAIRVNFSPLREFFISVRGGQDLGESNCRFYKDMAAGLHNKGEDKRLHFIDVGGNDGWFAKTIIRFFPDARITCYEPLKSQHVYLERLARKYPKFQYREAAVGNIQGTCDITEYGTSGLSSLKKISDSYKYPMKVYSQTVVSEYPVPVVRLDDDLPTYLHEDEIVILKVDTQGSELEVLRGVEGLLSQHIFRYVITELMTVRKYAGAALYDEIFDFLHKHGYKLYDINPIFYEQPTKRLSEFDAIFGLDP